MMKLIGAMILGVAVLMAGLWGGAYGLHGCDFNTCWADSPIFMTALLSMVGGLAIFMVSLFSFMDQRRKC
jgi:hypothetical protein